MLIANPNGVQWPQTGADQYSQREVELANRLMDEAYFTDNQGDGGWRNVVQQPAQDGQDGD